MIPKKRLSSGMQAFYSVASERSKDLPKLRQRNGNIRGEREVLSRLCCI
jgi:hypothetical protein